MPNKNLGQHWLFDSAYLEAIADQANLGAADTVLEVGPGLGTLTKVLTRQVQKVVAVELDGELAGVLKSNSLGAGNLEVVEADILKFNLSTLPKNYKVVANIPYYLTGKLLRRLVEADNPPVSLTLLVQKEVAERITSRPGQLSVIAIAAQLFGRVELGPVVPASAFQPPPEVDSQVIHVVRHPQPLFPDLDSQAILRIVKAGFSEKRKKLRSALSGSLRLTKTEADELLRQAGIAADSRAQELSLEEWHDLAAIWQNRVD